MVLSDREVNRFAINGSARGEEGKLRTTALAGFVKDGEKELDVTEEICREVVGREN